MNTGSDIVLILIDAGGKETRVESVTPVELKAIVEAADAQPLPSSMAMTVIAEYTDPNIREIFARMAEAVPDEMIVGEAEQEDLMRAFGLIDEPPSPTQHAVRPPRPPRKKRRRW